MEIPALAPVDGPPALFSVLISDEVSVLLDDSGSTDDGLEELVEVMIVRCDEVEVALVEVDLDVIDVIVADAGSVAVPVGSQYCSQTIQYLFSIWNISSSVHFTSNFRSLLSKHTDMVSTIVWWLSA